MARFLSIEVEAAQVRAAEIEERGKTRRIKNCFYFPVPQITVDDGQIRDTETLAELLGDALLEHGIRAKKVYYTVTSSRIASRELELPQVSKRKLQSILEANAADYFPVDVSQYVISGVVLETRAGAAQDGAASRGKAQGNAADAAGASAYGAAQDELSGTDYDETSGTGYGASYGTDYDAADTDELPADELLPRKGKEQKSSGTVRLMAYACPKSLSAGYQELSTRLGLTMEGLTCAGDGTYQALSGTFTSGLHMLVKIEYQQTAVTVFRDGTLALQRSLSYGVSQAAETVRSLPGFGENLSVEQALDLLCGESCLQPTLEAAVDEEEAAADRAEVTESFRYLISGLTRLMDYYSSRNQGAAFDSIEICGLGAMVEGLPELLGAELGQPAQALKTIAGFTLPEDARGEDWLYAAVVAGGRQTVNLMERGKQGRRQRESDDLRGAWLILIAGAAAGILLSAVGIGNYLYQKHVQSSLNARIDEESSIEEIYSAYQAALSRSEGFETLYSYTETPNENLADFIGELEEKMPSDITVESLSSTGSEVSFTFRVSGKQEAADVLISLRTFESLSEVVTTGTTESESGEVTMTVACTYADPAKTGSGEE